MIVAQGTDGLGYTRGVTKNVAFLPQANRRIPSQMLRNPRLFQQSPTLRALGVAKPTPAMAMSNPAAGAPASVANPSAAMTDAADPSDAFTQESPEGTIATPVIGDQANVPAKTTPDKPLVSKPVVFVAVAAVAGLGYFFFMRKRRKG